MEIPLFEQPSYFLQAGECSASQTSRKHSVVPRRRTQTPKEVDEDVSTISDMSDNESKPDTQVAEQHHVSLSRRISGLRRDHSQSFRGMQPKESLHSLVRRTSHDFGTAFDYFRLNALPFKPPFLPTQQRNTTVGSANLTAEEDQRKI